MGPPSKISLGIIGHVLLLNRAFLAKSFASESSSGFIAIYRKTIIWIQVKRQLKTWSILWPMQILKTFTDLEEKGEKKEEKLCTPEILVTHLRRTKIGVVYYLHHQWVCFESAGLNLSSSVWPRGCTHAIAVIQKQSIKGGQLHTDFSTLQIEINKLLISMHNTVNILRFWFVEWKDLSQLVYMTTNKLLMNMHITPQNDSVGWEVQQLFTNCWAP